MFTATKNSRPHFKLLCGYIWIRYINLVMIAISLLGLRDANASGLTHQMPDGNRLVQGDGLDLSTIQPTNIPLSGTPAWIVSNTYQNGILWVAVMTDGSVEAFKVANSEFNEITLNLNQLPAGAPPLLYQRGSEFHIWEPPDDASPWTHGILFDTKNGSAYIDKKGDLVLRTMNQEERIQVNALPDARLLKDEKDRILLLTDPTDQYAHGVLGDRLEAKSITLIETRPLPRIAGTIRVGTSEVIEGIMPIWVDADGDDIREIIVTVSKPGLGASLRVYRESGEVMAESSSIGRSFRWRNQAAVFDADGSRKLYLTDVLTPHIGGTLEFFEWQGDRLELASSLSTFTSHQIGSRNLDLALAGPFGMHGNPCMVLPNHSRGTLTAVGLIENQATTLWTQRLNGILTSNLSGAQTPSGTVALGLGTSKQTLQIWQAHDPTPYIEIKYASLRNEYTELTIRGEQQSSYSIQTSDNLITWHPMGDIALTDSTEASIRLLPPDFSMKSSQFFRAQQTIAPMFANVDSVEVSGEENAYTFHVTTSSPDLGCAQYADWWEILTLEGTLLGRRVLLHSHVNEQPFRRSARINQITADQTIIIRGHMNQQGYGGRAMVGSVANGFEPVWLPFDFANHLESMEPLPNNCAF